MHNAFDIGQVNLDIVTKPNLQIYNRGLAEAYNCFVDDIGNLRKRPGTEYVLKFLSSYAKFFYFDGDDKFIIVFTIDYGGTAGNNVILFIQNDSLVLDSTGAIFTLAHPYTQDELKELQIIQKDNSLYIAHENHQLQILKYGATSAYDWTLSTASLESDMIIAYGDGVTVEYKAFLMPEMLTPTQITLTYTINGVAYTATDDGAGNIIGTDITTSTINYTTGRLYVKFTYAPDLNTPIAVSFYDLSAQNIACVAFFGNRLWVARFGNHKQSVWGSKVGSYTNFALGGYDSDAVLFTISTNKQTKINWLIDTVGALLVGTDKNIFSVRGGSYGITPTSIEVERVFDYDTAYLQPVYGGKEVYFINSKKEKLYGVVVGKTVNDRDVFYNCVDLSIFTDVVKDIEEMEFVYYPYRMLLMKRSDGKVLVFRNSSAEKGIFGFYVWGFGLVQSVVFTGDVYMAVARFGEIYIEKLSNMVYSDYFDSRYNDCSKELTSATATNTFSVDWIPDGTTVSVLTDIGVHPNVEVVSGSITLLWDVTKVVVGLPYSMKMKTLPLEYASDVATVGYEKQISNLKLGLLHSLAGNVDSNGLIYRFLWYPIGKAVPLFSGWYDLAPPVGRMKTIEITVEQFSPTPFVLGAISMQYEVFV